MKERDKFAKSRKEGAFEKNNFQSSYKKIGMGQKDKAWKATNGVCGKCLNRELRKTPEIDIDTHKSDESFERIRERIDESLERKRERRLLCEFNAYTDEVSFYWTIHPELRVVLRCDDLCFGRGAC